jgi:simple sugar transport system permease protein
MTEAALTSETPSVAGTERPGPRRAARAVDLVIRSVVPVLLALVAGGLLLLALGRDPIAFYSAVWQGGVENGAWQDSAVLMAPLLLIAAGLTVIFRANIWNLGYGGQFLLAAAFVAGLGPWLVNHTSSPVAFTVLFVIGGIAGASLTIIPAFLKAKFGTNEIITTLMISFIGIDIANILIKGPFQDPAVDPPLDLLQGVEVGSVNDPAAGRTVRGGRVGGRLGALPRHEGALPVGSAAARRH